MKTFPFKRGAARFQMKIKNMAGLHRLAPARIASDDPPYSDDDESYFLMLRRRERSLGR